MVVVRPGGEMDRRVHDVLDAVEEDRARGADVEQPLDTVDLGAPSLEQHRQPDPEGRPVDRPVEHEP